MNDDLIKIRQNISRILNDTVKSNSINTDINDGIEFSGFSVNSITFVMLILNIEDEYEIEFDDDDLDINKYHSLDDLAEYVYVKANE